MCVPVKVLKHNFLHRLNFPFLTDDTTQCHTKSWLLHRFKGELIFSIYLAWKWIFCLSIWVHPSSPCHYLSWIPQSTQGCRALAGCVSITHRRVSSLAAAPSKGLNGHFLQSWMVRNAKPVYSTCLHIQNEILPHQIKRWHFCEKAIMQQMQIILKIWPKRLP